MNGEEKNAVEYLKTRLYGNKGCKYIDVAQEDLRIFIKLVDRLQKENEKLKLEEKCRIIGKYGEVEIHDVINRVLSNDYISKQKIKDKIEELKKRKMDIVTSLVHNADEKIEMLKEDKIRIQVLQELLEKENKIK